MTAHEFSPPWNARRLSRRSFVHKGSAALPALLFEAAGLGSKVLPALSDTTIIAAAASVQKMLESTVPTRDYVGNFLQLQLACALSENARKVFQRVAEGFKDHQTTRATTTYSASDLQYTQTVTIGDSITRGFLEKQIGQQEFEPKPYQMNVAANKTDAANKTFPDARWVWHNNAQDNSTAEDTLRQFDDLEIDKNPLFSTDFIISVGGNDIRHGMENIWQKVQPLFAEKKLKANDIIDFSNQAVDAIGSFKETFEQILRAVLKQEEKGIRVKRIFIEGLPNISVLEGIMLNNETFLLLNGNILNETVARNLCALANNAMTEAIDKLGPNPGCDILFMDNFDLTREDFTGSHPNEKGQQKMTRAQLVRSLVRENGTKTTLLEALEKRRKPIVGDKKEQGELNIFARGMTESQAA